MSEHPATLRLKVVTPASLAAEADAEAVFLPTPEGEIGIFPDHRPLHVALGTGILHFRAEGEEERLSVKGGFAIVGPDAVTVLTELGEEED